MKTVVLLSGCGVYDGSEIHESVFSMLALSEKNIPFFCVAPNINHHHVINHLNGKEFFEKRNVLEESSRISRGKITPLEEVDFNNVSSLLIPGGFGVAKNLSDWAFKGSSSDVLPLVKDLILHCVRNKKPIVSLCISPTIIAKSLEGSEYSPLLSVGNDQDSSDYDIAEINNEICALGSKTTNSSFSEISFDENLKIICAPCYMMKMKVDEVYSNIRIAVEKLKILL